MKIVDIAEFYAEKGGGVKTYINQKLLAGSKLGHEIVVVAPGAEAGETERNGGRIIWVPGPALPVDRRYYILWRERMVHEILDREQPDVVEGSSPWTGGWFAARWKGDAVKAFIFHQDPVAVYPHTILGKFIKSARVDKLFLFYWNYLRRLSKRYDATIVSGEWLANRLSRFKINNPVTVPFGIDKLFSTPNRRSTELRKIILEELGLPEDAILMIGISRHHPEKRLGTIFEGFRMASEHRQIGLVIFGDGPFRWMVKHQARGIPHIKLMGFKSNREELADYLASADYFVHGSAAETYGLVVAEAICSGLPVIVPAHGGAGDLADSEYSEVYEPGDSVDLSKAILRMLDRDRPAMVRACAVAAEHSIGTLDDHFRMLFETYQNMVDKRKKSGPVTPGSRSV
ncbi:glycosyltransferase [Balneolales bacterium ANBcel1]|nr:glycosyltransferase [Balneolales bacterium ANBcel1]